MPPLHSQTPPRPGRDRSAGDQDKDLVGLSQRRTFGRGADHRYTMPAQRPPQVQFDGGGGRAGATGGVLSMLAVGCPVCNKLVVVALGASGAMQWWAPLQPLVGVASVALLGWGLRTRLHGERACRVRTPAEPAPAEVNS